MDFIRMSGVTPVDADSPMFTGRATLQPLVTTQMSRDYTLTVVNFDRGIRNVWHRHSRDQVLIVTEGRGMVATDSGEVEVQVGDAILIPAGERHWHGALSDTTFSHIALNGPGSQIETAE
jgi:quercetin dioxygenase-like cupin family protein